MALLVDAPPDVGFMIVISPILSSSISILVTVSAALRKWLPKESVVTGKKFRKLKIHVKFFDPPFQNFIPIVTPPSFGEAAEATTPSTTEVITLPSASVKAKVVPPGLVPPEPPLGCRVSVTIDEPEVKECILIGCCSEIGNSTLSILPYFYDVWPFLERQLRNLTLRMLLGDFANTFQTRKPYKWIVMVWKSQKNSVGITNLLFKKFTIQNCNEGPLND